MIKKILVITSVALTIIYLNFFREKSNNYNIYFKTYSGATSLNDLKDHLVLLYFGYTYCPDICPTSLATMSSVFNKLPKNISIQGIMYSVDPDRDTLDQLKEYTSFFHENILGVTGSRSEINSAVKKFNAFYKLQNKIDKYDYSVDHTGSMYLIGKDMNLLAIIPHGESVGNIIKIILKFKKETI